MYVDTSYIIKFYLKEPESDDVDQLVQEAGVIRTSFWSYAEFHGALHRRLREGSVSPRQLRDVIDHFSEHVGSGVWELIPLTESVLRRTAAMIAAAPRNLFIRNGDAVHLTTARDAGEREVWTNDRHMLAAAAYFGLKGRSV